MRAHLGDQLVVESPATGVTRRDGEIVGLHHEDGTPPYDVHWSDTDEVTLVFPGPDAHVHHLEHGPRESPAPVSPPSTDEARQQTDAGAGTPPSDGASHAGDIGRRMAAARRRQGLTQAETARRAKMAPQYLAYLEERSADPSLATLIRLAAALGTSVAALRGAESISRQARARHSSIPSCGTSARRNVAPTSPRTAWGASRCRPLTVRRSFR